MGNENSKAVPTQDEYIAEQIAARKADALKKSLSRTKPRVPQGIKTGERWNSVTKKVEDIYELGPSCAYTFSDNYGLNWMGSEDFRQNHANYGWKQVPWEQRQPGNAVLIVDDEGVAKHTMMYDSDNAQGQPLFNHSNGGHDESAIRKKAKYPHHNPYLAYEFVGTPADSTLWINQYKQIYGMAKGGVFGIPKYLGGTPEDGDEKSTNELSLDKETKARSDRYSKETKVEAATIRRSQNHNGKLFQSYQGNYNLNTTPQNDTTFIYNIPNIHFQYNSDGVTGRKSYLYQDKKKGIIKHGITYDGTLLEDVLKYKLFGLDLLKITQNNKVSFKKGGGIHIKKKNRGKFREYCGGEVTDECILKAKKSKNPKLRKRATFALNSRSWSKKHADGGNIAIEGAKTIGGYLPFVGTALDAYELYKNPSWKQAGWTTLGLLTDIFTGGSARAVIKTARNLKNAKEALSIVRGPITKRIYKDAAVDAIKANTKAKKDVLRDASFNIGQNYVQYITDKYVKNNDNK